MKRMGDPLTYDGQVSSTDISALKFARLHSPKMKSVYWRYFGFPTNDNDRIITKQNVVCLICHKVLTNHGNTTNLRAHLQHRHKELFSRMCSENGIKIPPRKTMTQHTKLKYEPPVQKIKLEYQDNSTQDSSNAASLGCEDQAMLYESMVPITYEDDEVINGEHFAKVEVGGSVIVGRSITDNANGDAKSAASDLAEVVVTDVEQRVTSNFRIGLVEEMDTMQLQDALVNILIQDIRDVQSLFDPGMQNFVRMICGSMEIPSEKKLENLIKELHSDRLTSMSDQFKMHSLTKPYSLGFDAWSNVENKRFLSIYFNYTTDAPDYNLLNELYCTLEYNEFTPFDTLFAEFNLQYCVAALVNFEHDDYLKAFLRNKNIPIIVAFDMTVDKCLRSVFSLPNVSPIIDEIKEVITRYAQEINSKEVEIPLPSDECPWTYFELLKFFSETVSWPEDMDILVNSAKVIINTLTTLSVSLDTLKGEEIPHSSMLSPITAKILNKKLLVTDVDDDFVSAIKTTVATELQKLVISDDHLTIAALLDPRFHRLTTISNFSGCLHILKEKFNKICELKGFTPDEFSSIKSDEEKPKLATTSRKSNLELFFDIEDASATTTQHEENNVEYDLKRYRNEVHVALDESPFCWWNKMGHLYGSLKQLAAQYQCIPCVINMNFKKPIKQQIHEHRKRYMLTGNLIDAILFLHYNTRFDT